MEAQGYEVNNTLMDFCGDDFMKACKECDSVIIMTEWEQFKAYEYEKIIENPEFEIKKIINFCGLPWEEECLLFHKNKTPIKTMSTSQARQPIYKSSVNSFEKFAPFLKDLDKII